MARTKNPDKATVIPVDVPDQDTTPTTIIVQEPAGEFDMIGQGLLVHHTHFLTGEIGYENVARAIQWIVFEHTTIERADHLILYLNSGGGDLYNAFALVDIMVASSIPIYTVGVGNIMSAAALIFACGDLGHRYIAKHTGVMMHEFYSDMEGKEHELKASMIELGYCRKRVNDLMTTRCGITEKKIKEKLLQPSDVWLTAEEAIKYKLADSILTKIL